MSRPQKQQRSRIGGAFQYHNKNNSNRPNFKPQQQGNNRRFRQKHGNHGNNNHAHFNHANKQQQQQRQQEEQNVKKLPLPKGPLFERSKLILRWKQARAIGPGFVNGQNTCFLNSVLECLTYTPPLAQYFLYQGHRSNCASKRFCAMCAMDDHIHRCLKDQKSLVKGAAILPRAFTSNLRAFSPTLRLGRQEDAHEFMMFLLDAMHKATIYGYGKLDAKMERTAFIYQIFGGQLRSQLRCHSCNTKSNTFDNFLDLSVDLQQASSVQHALENFIKVDMIGGSDPDTKYRCDSCKQKVNASKQMTVHELPSMLCIHLKRFTFDMMRGYMRKITKDIKFTDHLDMAPFVSKELKRSSAIYNLYAVLVHLGYGCDSGHYYAYVKAPDGKWYRMDDEEVTHVSLKEVLSQQAYMLFYTSEKTLSPNETATAAPTMPIKSNLSNGDRGTKRESDQLNLTSDNTNKSDTSEQSNAPKSKIQKPNVSQGRLESTVDDTKKTVSSSSSSSSSPSLLPSSSSMTSTTSTSSTSSTPPLSPVVHTNKIEEFKDGNSIWVIQPSEKPFRSLRGNLSPPTFAAAVSDISAWTIESPTRLEKPARKKSKRNSSDWIVTSSSP